jgi:hypothetical protein
VKFIFILMLLMALPTMGKESSRDSKPISLQPKNLLRWKNSPVTQGLRKAFARLLATRKSCPECAEPFEGAFRYMNLYTRHFLTVDMEPGDFGGYFVLVVMKDYPRVFEAWVYQIDKGEYQLRELNPLEPRLDKEVMDAIADRRLTSFWIRPLHLAR